MSFNLKTYVERNGLDAAVGKPIQNRSFGVWKVVGVEGDKLLLNRWWQGKETKGRLDERTRPAWRVYPSYEEVEARYPRLINLMRNVCNLSTGEASNAIHGYLTSGPNYMGAEAVAWAGGAREVIRHALAFRSRLSA